MPSRISLLLGCCLLGIAFSFLPWLERPEQALYDARLQWMQETLREGIPRHPAIQMIGTDEKTRQSLPDFGPAEESRIAANLAAGGARGVLLINPDELDLHPALLAVQENTGILAEGLRLLAATGQPNPEAEHLLAQAGSTMPVGSLDYPTDSDGVVRRSYLALRLPGHDHPVPSGALLLYARLKGVPETDIRYEKSSILVGTTRIPTLPDYSIYVRFLSPRTFDLKHMEEGVAREYLQPVSALRLLDKEDPIYHFVDGRVFLMGDFLYDASQQVLTSNSRMKYIQFQACVLDTLVGSWGLTPLPFLAQLLITALYAWLLAHRTGRLRPLPALAVFMICGALYFLLGTYLFTRGWLIDITRPIVAAAVACLAMKAYQFLSIVRNLRKFGGRSAYEAARSLDESVLNEIREQEATILFCNMPDLLKDLEVHDSPDYFLRRQEFSMLLNEVAMNHRGTVLDFQGDAPMLGFGTELRRPDNLHAYHAVRASQEIVELSERLKHLWPKVDDTKLTIRCGVASGPVALGQVGARGSKLAQAAIGDTTNVAARLMGAAKKLGVDVLVTSNTQTLCAARFVFKPLAPIPLKGKTEPVPVAVPDFDA